MFTGKIGEHNGGVYIVNADGRQTRIFQGNNYIDGDDQFVDVNGDGLPEIVASNELVGADENDPNKYVTNATSLNVVPITARQVPLLRIVFDVRPIGSKPSWRWRLVDNATGTRDVVLEQRVKGDWTERAKFVWSADNNKYEGPGGSRLDGFIASSGNIETDQIRQFIKGPRSE